MYNILGATTKRKRACFRYDSGQGFKSVLVNKLSAYTVETVLRFVLLYVYRDVTIHIDDGTFRSSALRNRGHQSEVCTCTVVGKVCVALGHGTYINIICQNTFFRPNSMHYSINTIHIGLLNDQYRQI